MSYDKIRRKFQKGKRGPTKATSPLPKPAPPLVESMRAEPQAEENMLVELGNTDTALSRHLKQIRAAQFGNTKDSFLTDEARRKLDDFDGARLVLDKEMLDLNWRAFQGEAVDDEMAQVGQKNAQLIANTGYVELVKNGLGHLVGPDARELDLRNRELMLDNVRSNIAVKEMMRAARNAQLSFKAAIGQALLSADDIGFLAISNPDPDMRFRAAIAKAKSVGSLDRLKLALAQALAYASSELEGRPSYGHLLLETQDSDVDEMSLFIKSLKERTDGAMAELDEAVRSTFKLDRVPHIDRAYFYNTYFSLAFPDVIPKDAGFAIQKLKDTLKAMGFGKVHGSHFLDAEAIDKAPFTFDILGGEKHAPEECAMRAGPGGNDYRVFINPGLSPSGVEYMRTLLLESARAVHYYALDRLDVRPVFKWDTDCMRSAVAMLISSAFSEEKWLRDIAGLGAGDAKLLAATLSYSDVYLSRDQAINALFELKLQFGHDPEEAYRAAHEMFWGEIDYPVEKQWAWHPYLAFNPCGQITYALAHSIFEMMRKDIDQKFGTLLHPGAAEYLVDNHMAGYQIPWKERMKRILRE